MAILWAHGLDNLGSVAGAEDGIVDDIVGANSGYFSTGGRFGGGYIQTWQDGGIFTKTVSLQTDLTVELSMFQNGALTTSSNDGRFLRLFQDGTEQISCIIRVDGRISVFRGNNAVFLTDTPVGFVGPSRWDRLGVRIVFGDSPNGEVHVWSNGTTHSATGLDTLVSGAGCNNVNFLGGGASTTRVDDPIIHNGSSFIGDVRIYELKPTADTATADFTTSSGLDHYALVDDDVHDSDTTYVESSTATDQDIYTLEDLPANANTVKAVINDVVAKKDDAGARSVRTIVKSNTDTVTQDHALTTDYQHYLSIHETDPQGGGAWTVARVNAAEIGVEVV